MSATNQQKQTVRDAIRAAGGVTKWAQRLEITRSSIYDWIERAEVPPDRAVQIERESSGLASRAELRPKDYWRYWPDLDAPQEQILNGRAATE